MRIGPRSIEELVRRAESVRQRKLNGRPARTLQDVYTVSFWLARRLRRRCSDVRIMVGDDNRGQMHHWLETPSRNLMIDAAHDATDPADSPVVVRSMEEAWYQENYKNVLDSNFDTEEPRHQPQYVYALDSAEAMYKD